MFPLTLGESRKWVFGALTRCAWSFDQPETLTRWLGELGRDHRKFGVTEHHYRLFCDALLTTLRAFCAGSWPDQTQAAWKQALATITAAMTAGSATAQPGDQGAAGQSGGHGQPGDQGAASQSGGHGAASRGTGTGAAGRGTGIGAVGLGAGAAGDGAAGEPAWWLAEVVEHDRRRPDLAVLALRPDPPLPYLAGQHVSVQVPRWPRVWREYSIANAPAPDGLLRLHVRAVPGGRVSTALVHHTRAGDTVVLGRARGEMTADAITSARVVCIAGGTGLAPVKAIAEALTSPARSRPRPVVRLFFGARTRADLYDLPELRRLAGARGSLAVVPVTSAEPGDGGLAGTVAEAAAAHLLPGAEDIVISGPAAMVARAAALLAAAAPAARLHADPLPGASWPL